MWLIAMYDLPVMTREQRKEYALFLKFLIEDGFSRLQYSVYYRPCPSEENAKVHCERIKHNLPPNGDVRILSFTDAQFSRMKIYISKKKEKPEKMPGQISFF